MLALKIFRSSAALSAGRILSRGLDILAALVIANFLSPTDFGVVTLGLATLMVLEAFTELPVSDAIIREKELLREDVDTAFTLSFLRGLLVAAGLCAISFPMAMIYGDDRLVLLICLLAIAPVATGLRSPMMVTYARAVNYTPFAVIDAGARIVSFVLATGCAWLTQSYLSLLLLSITPQIIDMVATYLFAPYRPRFSLKKWRLLLSFAGMVTISRVFATLSGEGDRFLIGGFVSKAAVGFFSMGRSVATTASWSLSMPLIAVMYPGLAQIREDMPRYRNSYLRGNAMIVMLIMPLSLALAMLADPLVRLGLNAEWIDVVPVIQVLALVCALASFSMSAHAVALSLGEPQQLIWREAISFAVAVPAVIFGAIYGGLMGAVAGRAFASLIHTAVSLEMIARMTGIPIVRQFTSPWRSVVSSIVFVIFLYFGAQHIVQTDWLTQLLSLAAVGAMGVAIYAGVHLALWRLAGLPQDGPERFLLGIAHSILPRVFPPMKDVPLG